MLPGSSRLYRRKIRPGSSLTQMADFYALTTSPLPKKFFGTTADCSIRPLSSRERLAIEDYFFKEGGLKSSIEPTTTAMVVSHALAPGSSPAEFAILVEFLLGVITISGFMPVGLAASFNGLTCADVVRRPLPLKRIDAAQFSKSLTGTTVITWVRRFFMARTNSRDRMHITADRFVRYLRTENVGDSLTDLCISLESLLDTQTEISFRFGTHFAKVTGQKGVEAQETARLLSSLYDLRSKIVHGADATRERLKIEPYLPALHRAARVVLTNYVLFMSDHTRQQWKEHLHQMLFE